MTVLSWLLRVALAGVFLVAGALKLHDPTAFAVEITNYRLLPELAPYLAVTLPTVELAVGIALLLPGRRWWRAGALGAAGLLAMFTVAVLQVRVRGINISCGCFGGDSGPVTGLTVLRDLGLLAMAVGLSAWPALTIWGRPPAPRS